MKFIKLHNRGLVTRVSDEDYERLNAFKWILGARQYAVRHRVASDKPGGHFVYLHREVLAPPQGMLIDHIDGDSLNNQRENLRIADIGLNTHNMPSRAGSTSKYKGVCWAKDTGRWQAQYKYMGNSIYLGQFDNEEDAARAYDEEMRKVYGKNAYQNFPLLERLA